MTKKDIILISSILKELGEEQSYCFDSGHDRYCIAQRFAGALRKANSKFDRKNFIKAATLEDDEEDYKDELNNY